MSYAHKRVAAQIARAGRRVTLFQQGETAQNAFGNPDGEYVPLRELTALRTYSSSNSTSESRTGTTRADTPLFLVAVGPEKPPAPQSDDRLDYDDTMYHINSVTRYDTHVECEAEALVR